MTTRAIARFKTDLMTLSDAGRYFRYPYGPINFATNEVAVAPNASYVPGEYQQFHNKMARSNAEGAILRAYASGVGAIRDSISKSDLEILRLATPGVRGILHASKPIVGGLEIVPSGQPGFFAKAGRSTYKLVPSEATRASMSFEISLRDSAEEFMTAVSGTVPAMNESSQKLLDLAAYIYKSLHINSDGDMARFYLIFDDTSGKLIDSTFASQNFMGTSTFIRVKLGKEESIWRSQIAFIAQNIASSIGAFVVKYGLQEIDLPISGVTINQDISIRHSSFPHVITGATRVKTPIEYLYRSPDIMLRMEAITAHNRLVEAGRMLASPGSYFNCLGNAIWLAERDLSDRLLSMKQKKAMWAWSSKLMARLGLVGEDRELGDMVRALKKKWNGVTNINLYDYRYHLVDQIVSSSGTGRGSDIMLFAGHAYALVSDDGQGPRTKENNENILIPKTFLGAKKIRLGAGDIETTADTIEAYAIAYRFENTKIFMFTGKGCVLKFLNHLKKTCRPGELTYLAFHNGGRFDDYFIISELEASGWRMANVLEHNGRILFFDLVTSGMVDNSSDEEYRVYKLNMRVRIFDSIGILPMSLEKAGHTYCSKHQKLVGKIDHKKMRSNTWEERWREDNGAAYLIEDVETLLEAMQSASKVYEKTYGSPVIGHNFTLSGASQSLWLRRFYDPETYPLYTLTDRQHYIGTRTYFGGCCIVYYRGEALASDWGRYEDESIEPYQDAEELLDANYHHGRYFKHASGYTFCILDRDYVIEDVDAKAMYPAMQIKNEYPYGLPTESLFSTLPEGFMGAVNCTVSGGHKKGANFLRVKTATGVCAPYISEPITDWWTSADIRAAMEPERNYTIEFHGGIRFKSAPYFKEGLQHLFDVRESYARDTPEFSAAKTASCSVYGGFAIAKTSQTLIVRPPERELSALFSAGLLRGLNKYFALVEQEIETLRRNVLIASFVTSHGYSYLMSSVRSCNGVNGGRTVEQEEDYGSTMYMDTDSQHRIRHIDYPHMHYGDLLGEFDDEVPYIRRAIYVTKKAYALQYRDSEGNLKEKVRFKGFPHSSSFAITFDYDNKVIHFKEGAGEDKLCYEHFRMIIQGWSVYLHTVRFLGGLTSWVSSDRPNINIREYGVRINCALRNRRITKFGWTEPTVIFFHYYGRESNSRTKNS